MLEISTTLFIPLAEIEIASIRAQGPGGQNVNKVSSAIHLRFDIVKSSLSEEVKQRLLQHRDSRISGEGVVVIKAQRYRNLEKNRADALDRLRQLVLAATQVQKARRATKPGKNAKRRRVDSKTKRGKLKVLRKKIDY